MLMVKYPTGSLTHYTKDQTDLLHPRKQKHRKDVVFSDRGMSQIGRASCRERV